MLNSTLLPRVLSALAISEGSGPTPRTLAHPAVLELDVLGNPQDPLAEVSVRWVPHPAVVKWMDEWEGSPAELLTRVGVSSAPRRARNATLRLRAGALEAVGPALPEPGYARVVLAALARHGKTPVIGTRAWFAHARILNTAVVAVSGSSPVEVLAGPPLAPSPTTPVEAMRLLEAEHFTRPVAADAVSVDLAAIDQAAPAGRPGLHPAQDLAVSQLRATSIGAVLAHPPGSGKSVIVSSAIAEAAASRSVILAPPAVIDQWVAELGRWAPGRRVVVARRSAQLPAMLSAGEILLATHDIGASWLAALTDPVDAVYLDEGHAILGASRRARSLWQSRRGAHATFLLSGTPEERHSRASAESLVAWARNASSDPGSGASPASLHPALLLPVQSSTLLPTLSVKLEEAVPRDADLAWLVRLAALLDAAATPFQRARASDLIRKGLAGPAALGETGAWYKDTFALELLREHAADGSCALVCADTVTPLTRLTAQLAAAGVPAATLTSTLPVGERARMLAAFAAGDIRVLAVTPAAQRGVNLQSSSLVVHLDLPASLPEFEQRNGRAARIGSRHEEVRVVVPVLSGTWEHAWASGFLSDGRSVLAVVDQQGNCA